MYWIVFLILIISFAPLIDSLGYNGTDKSCILRYALLSGGFNYSQPIFPDIATAVQYGKLIYSNMNPLLDTLDMYATLINQANGLPLNDMNNTRCMVQYDIFNIDLLPLQLGDVSKMLQLFQDSTNATGPYGKYDFFIQLVVPPYYIPYVSQLCQGHCIVLNMVSQQDEFYICDDIMPDCVALNKKPGYRRFENVFTDIRDFSQIADNQITQWQNVKVNSIVIISSTDKTDLSVLYQIQQNCQDAQINILDIYFITASNNVDILPIESFTFLINKWVEYNVESIIVIGNGALITQNWTLSLQNLLYEMKNQDFMPMGFALNVATLDFIDHHLFNWMWININWDSSIRGRNYRAYQKPMNFELFPSANGTDSPQVFQDTFYRLYPENINLGGSSMVINAVFMGNLVITQKLLEAARSTNYNDIIMASHSISEPSMFGLIQFDSYGRLVTITNNLVVGMISSTSTSYSFNPIFPVAVVDVVFPMPKWSERTYSAHQRNSVAEKNMLAVNIVICVIIFCFMLFTFVAKYNRVIMAASPPFLGLFLIGNLFLVFSLMIFNLDPTSGECAGTIWLFSLGFDLMYLSLILKNFRINKIFNITKLFNKQKMNNFYLFKYLMLFFSMRMLFLFVWNINGGMISVLIVPDSTRISNNYHSCIINSKDVVFAYIEVVSKIALVLMAAIIAWRTRQVDEGFNESRYVANSIYVTLLVGLLFVGLIIFGSLNHHTAYIVINVGVWICCISTIVIMYSGKLEIIFYSQKSNRVTTTTTTTTTTAQQSVTFGLSNTSSTSNSLQNAALPMSKKLDEAIIISSKYFNM